MIATELSSEMGKIFKDTQMRSLTGLVSVTGQMGSNRFKLFQFHLLEGTSIPG